MASQFNGRASVGGPRRFDALIGEIAASATIDTSRSGLEGLIVMRLLAQREAARCPHGK